MPRSTPSRTAARALLAGLLALALSACQLRIGADIEVRSGGDGTFELLTAADGELVTMLAEAGVDLRTGLEEAVAAAPAWEVEATETDDGGLELAFSTTFDDPTELEGLVEELHAGLDEEDGALLRDLTVDVADDGAVSFAADAGVLLPTSTGVEGEDVAFDADDLEALIAERGDELVRADLRLTLPGPPVSHDADEVDGRNLVWRLPVGEMRPVSARSDAPEDRTLPVAIAVAAGALVIAALVVALVRRRGARRGAARAAR